MGNVVYFINYVIVLGGGCMGIWYLCAHNRVCGGEAVGC